MENASMEMQSGLAVGVAAFVGRERERAKVGDLVAHARVVTLTGGCGKTRLAVEVVGDVASRFPDGACWVDLQGVSGAAMVAPAVGAAVNVHELSEQALTDTLAEHLHARHLLVVLDEDAGYPEAAGRYVTNLLNLLQQEMQYEGPTADDAAVLGTISAPVLLLLGSNTEPFFVASARHVADHVPNARIQEIPSAGHAAPLTHPEALAEALTEFFAPAQKPA